MNILVISNRRRYANPRPSNWFAYPAMRPSDNIRFARYGEALAGSRYDMIIIADEPETPADNDWLQTVAKLRLGPNGIIIDANLWNVEAYGVMVQSAP